MKDALAGKNLSQTDKGGANASMDIDMDRGDDISSVHSKPRKTKKNDTQKKFLDTINYNLNSAGTGV